MNQKSRNQTILLVVLLGLLTFSIFSQITGGPRSANPQSVSEKTKPNPAFGPSAEVLQMHLLDHSVPELSGVKRNIFQFESKAEVVEARPPRVQLPPPVISQPPAQPNVHYLGFYLEKESGVKMASISNSGKIYVGKIGQVLGGKYELLEISPEFIRLRLVQDGKVLRVPLGKGPLNGLDDSAELDEGEEEEEE